MTQQYLFFCTNIGNELLLKEEIKVFYPELRLSYSRKGFLTFKNTGVQYDQKSISQLDVAFATRVGICLGKSHPDDVKLSLENVLAENSLDIDKCIIHSFSINTDYDIGSDEIFNREVNEYSPINKTVIDIITLGEKEVWFGFHVVGKHTTNYPNSKVAINIPKNSPSRGYLKVAEAIKLFNLNISKKDSWLDFGSAPGGSSLFLLEEGHKVSGVDPAKVSSEVLKNDGYRHYSKAVQDLSHEDLPDRHNINWVHADININPKQAIKEVLRICKKYDQKLKGIIFTIPVIKIDHIKNIERYEDHFFDWGFEEVYSRQIPSHKKEYVIIARR